MIYVVGDIHGNDVAFQNILSQINLKNTDELYVLGDVIDRGEHGIPILKWIMDHDNVHMLLGNHEYMMLDTLGYPREKEWAKEFDPDGLMETWYYNGGETTHRSFLELPKYDRSEIITYLRDLPISFDISVNNTRYRLVHANTVEMYQQLDQMDLVDSPKEYFCVWDRKYTFDMPDSCPDQTIIFGHTPTRFFAVEEPMKVFCESNMIGIDCGAAYPHKGGRLACIRLDDRAIFYSN